MRRESTVRGPERLSARYPGLGATLEVLITAFPLRTLGTVALLAFASSCGRESVPAPRAAPDIAREETLAAERLVRIRAELASAPGTGVYTYSNDSWCGNCSVSEHVELAPHAGVVWTYQSGFGGLSWTNHGDVVESRPDRILVRWALDPATLRTDDGVRAGGGLSDELFVVAWGSYSFLVPRDRMRAFCDEINARGDARMAAMPWRWTGTIPRRTSESGGDDEPAPDGSPAIPIEFRPLLLPKPIQTRVTAAGESVVHYDGTSTYAEHEIALTVDAGSRSGLARGMRLFRVGGGGSGTIVEISDDHAVVRFTALVQHNRIWQDPPEVGAHFSTRADRAR